MIKKRKFSARQAKKYADEGVQDVVKVNVLDNEGNPVEESEMTEKEVEFASKVAGKVYKKFSKSKKIKFSSEEDAIEVQLPEEMPTEEDEFNEAVDAEANAIYDEAESDANNEVTTEVEIPMEDETVEVTEEHPEEVDETQKVFSRKKGKKSHKFSVEDGDAIEVDLAIREDLEDGLENEPEVPEEVEDETPDGVAGLDGTTTEGKSFSATNKVMNKMFGRDHVTEFKAKFFSANRRK